MSGRIFQNVVLQFKETTDRTIGVIDSEGTVIACSELTGIGKKWTKYVEPIAAAEGNCVTMEGKTFKAMPGWGTHFDYAVFTSGDDSVGRTVCSMACVALNAAKVYYEEKHDKGSFIKNIISDNILISDIHAGQGTACGGGGAPGRVCHPPGGRPGRGHSRGRGAEYVPGPAE